MTPTRLSPLPGPARHAVVAAAFLALAAPLSGQHDHAPPRADSGSRRVQTLTEAEVAGLLEGDGMGLARPAELNGYPGPRHVLDLADALELTDEQRARTRAIHEAMHRDAVSLGGRIVGMEEELDRAFARRAGAPGLQYLVGDIAKLRGELRWVHLRAHLETAALLTDAQRAEYARLRGHATASRSPGAP